MQLSFVLRNNRQWIASVMVDTVVAAPMMMMMMMMMMNSVPAAWSNS
jgi:hypothetical protein